MAFIHTVAPDVSTTIDAVAGDATTAVLDAFQAVLPYSLAIAALGFAWRAIRNRSGMNKKLSV